MKEEIASNPQLPPRLNYPLYYWYFAFKDKSKIKYWDKSSMIAIYDAPENWKYTQQLQGLQTKVPSQALSTIKGGDTILVEDSLNLPPDWKDHNLGGIIGMTDQEPPCGEATNDKVHKYT